MCLSLRAWEPDLHTETARSRLVFTHRRPAPSAPGASLYRALAYPRHRRDHLVREHQERLVAQRRTQQVIEADLLTQPQDLVDDPAGAAVDDYVVHVPLDRIDARGRPPLDVGGHGPLRPAAGRLARLLIGRRDRDQPRHWDGA